MQCWPGWIETWQAPSPQECSMFPSWQESTQPLEPSVLEDSNEKREGAACELDSVDTSVEEISKSTEEVFTHHQSTEAFEQCSSHETALDRLSVQESQEVEVTSLSGETLRLQLPGNTSMGEMKIVVQKSWGIPCYKQKLVVGSQIVNDSATVDALIDDCGTSSLHVTMMRSYPRFLQPDYCLRCRQEEMAKRSEDVHTFADHTCNKEEHS